MTNRIKTGIPGLDKKIQGGFPIGSSILLVGPPGSGKTTLAHQFMKQGLSEKQPGLYTTLDMSPDEVIKEMNELDGKIDRKMIKFIDAYSWRVGKSGGDFSLSNLANVNELNIMVTKLIEQLKTSKMKRSVFNSVSTLLLYADSALVVKMIPVIIAKMKQSNFTQIWIMEEGVHDPRTVTTMSYFADGAIEFKMEGDQRFIRISRMRGTSHKRDWIKYNIDKKGIRF